MKVSTLDLKNTRIYAIDKKSCVVPEDFLITGNSGNLVAIQFSRTNLFKVCLGSWLDFSSCCFAFIPRRTRFIRKSRIFLNDKNLSGIQLMRYAFKSINVFLKTGANGFFLIKSRHFFEVEKKLYDWRKRCKRNDLEKIVNPILASQVTLEKIWSMLGSKKSHLFANFRPNQYGDALNLLRSVKNEWQELASHLNRLANLYPNTINLLILGQNL